MEKSELELDVVVKVLKLLGDKTRLTMIALLEQDDFCVCEFVEMFQMSQPAISQHLRKMKDCGLVKETRKSQWIIYSLNKESEMFPLLHDLLTHLPDYKAKVKELEEKGLRVICN